MTPAELYDASESGDPVLWSHDQIEKFMDRHEYEQADIEEFYHENFTGPPIDAAIVLEWAGY